MRQVCTVVWEDWAARASGRRSTVRIILGHGQKIRAVDRSAPHSAPLRVAPM